MKSFRSVAAAVAATLVLTGTPVRATPAPAASPEMVRAMRRDLGLTAGQAASRLVAEERARRAEPALRGLLGPRFGGAWLAADGSFVVATADAADAPAIAASGARPSVVARPLAALEATRDLLDRAAHLAGPGVHGWYVDEPANDVVVLAADQASGTAFVSGSKADPSVVRVRTSTARPVPYADIRGGDTFVVRDKGRCIVGFTVRRGTTGGFLTAGHCGQRGDVALTGYGGTPIGVFEASSYPGDDYAWVSLHPGWTPRGTVVALGVERPVRGAAPAPVGSSVCQAGPATGWHCGIVQQRNATVVYPGGTVTGLVRTSVCAEPGTSGAPFLSGDQAQGMTSGGSGNCSVGGTTYFQPVAEPLSAFGLTLVTG
ncbi:S1 family peptidase [Nonomuraea sp. KM90]|uniref:S1 family peptidase n=1 Tax=Nonomuraea sp. KM90 TaxID=3457428 RepID=UPI003FCE8C96